MYFLRKIILENRKKEKKRRKLGRKELERKKKNQNQFKREKKEFTARALPIFIFAAKKTRNEDAKLDLGTILPFIHSAPRFSSIMTAHLSRNHQEASREIDQTAPKMNPKKSN